MVKNNKNLGDWKYMVINIRKFFKNNGLSWRVLKENVNFIIIYRYVRKTWENAKLNKLWMEVRKWVFSLKTEHFLHN